MSELTNLQRLELKALIGDRAAVVQLVSALRKYREAATVLQGHRYQDGEVDTVALSAFFSDCQDIENDGGKS